jgi:hypothetical protein
VSQVKVPPTPAFEPVGVAAMGASDPNVSVDLLVKSLFNSGRDPATLPKRCVRAGRSPPSNVASVELRSNRDANASTFSFHCAFAGLTVP